MITLLNLNNPKGNSMNSIENNFDLTKFQKIAGAVWNMDYSQSRLTIPAQTDKQEDFDALVGYRKAQTKEWLWIRKDFVI